MRALESPSLHSSQFLFQLIGSAASNYIVQVSTNLAAGNWLSLHTNATPFWFTNAVVEPQQFYRGLAMP